MRTLVKAITFDAAGTLFQLREAVGEGYAKVAKRHGLTLRPGEVEDAFRLVWSRLPPPHSVSPEGSASLVSPEESDARERLWWKELVRQVVDTCGFEGLEGQAFDNLFEDLFAYYASPSVWALCQGVRGLLDRLKGAGLSLAVVSNFDSRLEGIVEGLGIRPYFRALICSGKTGASKPDPAIFLAAAAALEVPPEWILHVGDDRKRDLEGARAAGFEAQLIAPGTLSSAPFWNTLLAPFASQPTDCH